MRNDADNYRPLDPGSILDLIAQAERIMDAPNANPQDVQYAEAVLATAEWILDSGTADHPFADLDPR